MRVYKVHLRRIVSSLLVLTLSVTLLQAIPVAFPNIFGNLAKASDTTTAACPSVNGTNGVLSGTNPIKCTYSNVQNNSGFSPNIPIGSTVTATLVGGSGGGGGSDGPSVGMAGGVGATVVVTFTTTNTDSSFAFCIGNGGGGGAASAS